MRAPLRRLLVIEHDLARQAQLRAGLQAAGFEVDLAGTGQLAVAQARDQAYDAITLGMQLPDQPGLGALAGIRAEGASRASPRDRLQQRCTRRPLRR